jgi:NAD+ synthase
MNIKERTEDIIRWIKDWFETNGKDCNAVVGISGGKDSLIVAALCVKALGRERVIGVMMPNGGQKDIQDALYACAHLGIQNIIVNIGPAINALKENLQAEISLSEQTETNLPARIRMATLYAVSQSWNGRVANTCNLSENYVGYETKYGDGAGDFSPLGNLTVREVLEIGDYLGLPHHLVHKVPIDGLKTNPDGSYVTDEQSLGFTYEELDNYLLNGIVPSEEKLERIEQLHARGVAKRQMGVYEKLDPATEA